MQAMILAAGFGTRLLPYTEKKPKPLFPLLNTPLLQITIEKLIQAGFDHIVVNTHHLRKQFREITAPYANVFLQEEEEILGTGGGLRQALANLRDEPLLIINGDVYHNIDLAALYRYHTSGEHKITLAVHDYPRFNSLEICDNKLLGFNGRGKKGALAFTGIHVVNPEILEPIPLGTKSCIIERYASCVTAGDIISLSRTDDFFWTDIGTPEDYLDLHADILQGKIHSRSLLEAVADCYNRYKIISEKAIVGNNLKINDWACIGDAYLGNNVTISRSVIWDGAEIPSNTHVMNSIITQ